MHRAGTAKDASDPILIDRGRLMHAKGDTALPRQRSVSGAFSELFCWPFSPFFFLPEKKTYVGVPRCVSLLLRGELKLITGETAIESPRGRRELVRHVDGEFARLPVQRRATRI
jgi:hypothetical protein